MESNKAPQQIRIKTLEEIRQEKAAKSQSQKHGCDSSRDSRNPAVTPEINKTKTTKGVKRAITIKDDSITHIKTFSEILHAKKRRQEEEQEQNPSLRKAKHTVDKAPGKRQGEPDRTEPGPEATNVVGVRVKTLEEIRREKAARIQAEQVVEAENKKSSDTEENGAKKPRLLRIKKLQSMQNSC